jgi:hypothetical protein
MITLRERNASPMLSVWNFGGFRHACEREKYTKL